MFLNYDDNNPTNTHCDVNERVKQKKDVKKLTFINVKQYFFIHFLENKEKELSENVIDRAQNLFVYNTKSGRLGEA